MPDNSVTPDVLSLGQLFDFVAYSSERSLCDRVSSVLNSISNAYASVYDDCQAAFISYMAVKLRILKILTDLGLKNENHIAVLARLIEVLANNRTISPERAIAVFAAKHNATTDSIDHIIEKNFKIYDPAFVERVTALTKSNPFTPKEVLSDIAVYVRKHYAVGGMLHA